MGSDDGNAIPLIPGYSFTGFRRINGYFKVDANQELLVGPRYSDLNMSPITGVIHRGSKVQQEGQIWFTVPSTDGTIEISSTDTFTGANIEFFLESYQDIVTF